MLWGIQYACSFVGIETKRLNSYQKLTMTHSIRHSRLLEFWGIFSKNRLAMTGLVIFLIFFVIAICGFFCTYGENPVWDPAQVRLQEKLLPPMTQAEVKSLNESEIPPFGIYILGTDNLGRDVFSRMLQGAWVSLTVGFVAVGISVVIGVIFGGIAGYFGEELFSFDLALKVFLFITGLSLVLFHLEAIGLAVWIGFLVYILWSRYGTGPGQDSLGYERVSRLKRFGISIDTIIMRFVDIMLCFPSFFLILTVIALLPASIYNIMVVIGLTSWMGTARFVRAEFLSLREQDFVTAARALGLNNFRIIFQHMLPNAVAPVLVSATIGIATAILTEAGLSFLGFGVPPPQATWGNILSEGKRFIFDAPWLTLIPGIAILIVVLAFNLFGEGLRDTLNPRLRA